MQSVFFEDLGYRSYKSVWDWQEEMLKEKVAMKAVLRQTEEQRNREISNDQVVESAAGVGRLTKIPHHLLFVEHSPVYTLGKSGKEEHILIPPEEMAARGIDYFHINRGGDITFHGPQQVVGYPIIDLEQFKTDLGWYLRSLEEVIILTMADYGLKGERSKGETGVWLDPDMPGKERKICAMGIKCSRWITMHGFAFNINTDLSYFDHIVPCGIVGKQVTSLQKELGREVDFEEVKERLKKYFEAVFDVKLEEQKNRETEEYRMSK
ncbi:lipoyl(octanoyl) transferase LipB [Sediminibacterium sp.]|uniref:lipoyl(octanoyl) transferase LipB n=1 Tax=Sediminibacterium sp. TaxID=1917865 RepID=UPI0025CF133C|nr:lipoyl(octanoyl) transferase LipB [Sediminibacterium sp.]MBW0177472.1 lipoyl(octanoyl) transferase LipB [Sediminibacterium sp.]